MSSAEKSFKPGLKFSIDSAHDFTFFEDKVAAIICPGMTHCQKTIWDGRANIFSDLRPQGFNGRLAGMALEVMLEPYARLLDARDRGLALKGRNYARKDREEHKKYLGFIFRSSAMSSGRGQVGEIYVELWYAPAPGLFDDKRRNNALSSNRSPVRRFVTKPIITNDRVREVRIQSTQNARSILANNVARPLLNPMQN